MSNVTLDDRDSSITFSTGQWGQAGSSHEFDSTTTWTSLRGATAQVSFNGTSIGVYGTIVQKGLFQDPISSYTVDSNTPVVFTGQAQAATQYKQLFFQSPTLPAGTHTLTITNNVDGDQLFLDFFAVVPSDLSSSSASSSSSTSPLSASTSETKSTTSAVITPTVPVTVTVTQGTSSTAAANSQTAKSVSSTSNGGNSGAILGGVVGGVVLLALLVVVFFFVRQRRRRAEMDEALNGSNFWDPQPSHDMSTEALKPPPRSYPSYPSMSQAKSDFIPYQTTGDSSQYHGPQVHYQPPQGQYQTPQMQYQNPPIQYQHAQNQYQTPPNQYPTAPSRYQTQTPYRPAAYAQNQYPGPADYSSPPSPSELPYHSGSDVNSPGAGGPNRYLPPSQVIANGGQP